MNYKNNHNFNYCLSSHRTRKVKGGGCGVVEGCWVYQGIQMKIKVKIVSFLIMKTLNENKHSFSNENENNYF